MLHNIGIIDWGARTTNSITITNVQTEPNCLSLPLGPVVSSSTNRPSLG